MKSPYYAYIASPLFHPEDLKTIQFIEDQLDHYGIPYFSPRKEGGDLAAVPPEERQAAAKSMYDMNMEAILKCNLMIVNLDPTAKYPTPVSDLGTVFEEGVAAAKKCTGQDQKILSLGTKGQKCNIMLAFTADCHLTSLDRFSDFMKHWLEVNQEDYDQICERMHRPHGDME